MEAKLRGHIWYLSSFVYHWSIPAASDSVARQLAWRVPKVHRSDTVAFLACCIQGDHVATSENGRATIIQLHERLLLRRTWTSVVRPSVRRNRKQSYLPRDKYPRGTSNAPNLHKLFQTILRLNRGDHTGKFGNMFVNTYINVSVIWIDRVNDQAANFFSNFFVGTIAGKANCDLIVYLRHTGCTAGGESSNSSLRQGRNLAD